MKEVDENIINEFPDIDVIEPTDRAKEMLEEIKTFQAEAKKNLAKTVAGYFKGESLFAKNLREYRDKLQKDNEEAKQEDAAKLINTMDQFFIKAKALADSPNPEEMAEDFFMGENGYRDLVLGIKKVNHNNFLPGDYDLAEQCDVILKNSMNAFEPGRYAINKFVALNSGDFNIEVGTGLLDGVAKAAAGYEWIQKNGKESLNDEVGADATPFSEKKINKYVERMKENEFFKSQYATEKDGKIKWDEKKLEEAVKNNSEWKVSSLILKDVLEKRKKRKAEQDAIGKQVQDAKIEEYRQEAARRTEEFINILKDEEKKPEDEDDFEDDFFDGLDKNVNNNPKANKAPEKQVDNKKKSAIKKADPKDFVPESVNNERFKEAKIYDNYSAVFNKHLTAPEKVAVNCETIASVFKNLSKDFKDYIKEFRNAQVDKEANDSLLSFKEEGPKDYRAVLEQMYKMEQFIDVKNTGLSINRLCRELDKLNKLVKTYVKEHKPRIRGHRTAESAERYNIMERLSDKGSACINTLSSLIKETDQSIKEAGAGDFSYKTLKLHELDNEIKQKYLINDMDSIKKKAKATADAKVHFEEKNIVEKRIIKGLKATTEGLDIDGCYDSMEEVDNRYDSPNGSEKLKPLRSTTFASSFDIVEAALVQQKLRLLKTRDTTLSDLRDMEKNIKSGGFKKEVFKLQDAGGFNLDMEVAKKLKYGDMIKTANKIISGAENNMQQLKWVSDAFNTMSVNDLKNKTTFLDSYKTDRVSPKLVYNIAVAGILSKPENIDMYTNWCSPSSSFNVDKNGANLSNKAIKKDVYDYLRKTDFFKNVKKKIGHPEGSVLPMEKLPEVVKAINDPKFQKGLTNVLKKSIEREMSKNRPKIREGADKFIERRKREASNAKKYKNMEKKEQEKKRKEEAKSSMHK